MEVPISLWIERIGGNIMNARLLTNMSFKNECGFCDTSVALRSLGNENFKKRESYDKNKHSLNIVRGGAKDKRNLK